MRMAYEYKWLGEWARGWRSVKMAEAVLPNAHPSTYQAHMGKMPMSHLLLALMLLLEAVSCRTEPAPEVPPGAFEARVQGVLADTVRGEATYRTDAEGRLAHLELDASDSSEGLSFELEPLPRAPRDYVVPHRRPGGQAPAVRAYLDVRGHSFRARAGTLHVERASARRLEGTFRLQMEAPVEAPYDEWQPIVVRGQFDAAPASSSPPPATE